MIHASKSKIGVERGLYRGYIEDRNGEFQEDLSIHEQ